MKKILNIAELVMKSEFLLLTAVPFPLNGQTDVYCIFVLQCGVFFGMLGLFKNFLKLIEYNKKYRGFFVISF